MKREVSAGGIVFNNKAQVLLVQTESLRSYQQNGHVLYWGFPKGRVEVGESSEQAAVREVREEGGIGVEVISKIGDSKYVYTKKGEKIFKLVTLYLMKYLSGDVSDHDQEVKDVGWYQPEEALEKLTFSIDKEHLKKALEMWF